jgi:hypothetical protein
MLFLSIVPPVLLGFICLAYIFWSTAKHANSHGAKTRLDHLRERLDVVYENLRDLNFEFRAGKYEASDYNIQRDLLEQEAEVLLKQIDRLEGFKKKLTVHTR